jgi:hypothetical protein
MIQIGLGLFLTSNQNISIITYSISGLIMWGLIIFFGRRSQWELVSRDELSFEIYFRLGNFKIKRRSFQKTEIKELLIEQDKESYFNLYLVLLSQRIKIIRLPTRNAIEDLRNHLATILHWS